MDKETMHPQRVCTARARRTIAASVGRKRLAFQLGNRGHLVLLIINRSGVWSLRHRRYVKQTRFLRFHSLKAEAVPVAKQYAALRELGMHSWPEYAAEQEQVTLWKRRLADMYWDAAPAAYREDAARYLRTVRWDRRLRFLNVCVIAAMFVALCLFMAKVAWSGLLPLRTVFLNLLFGLCLLYKPALLLREWFEDGPDVIGEMLELGGINSTTMQLFLFHLAISFTGTMA
ncbi:hypothetical protein BS78_08G032800 [Paspalum vaginatum]|nr:hypothetical protein BS78_08G032800 [Paspalum vaginatum]